MSIFKIRPGILQITSNTGDFADFVAKADAAIDSDGFSDLLSIGVVHSCVKVIAESIASMPVRVMQKSSNSNTFLYDYLHKLNRLLQVKPNKKQSPFFFMEEILVALLIKGRSFTQIIRSNNGDILQMVNLPPDRVTPGTAPNGEPAYLFRLDNGSDVSLKNSAVMAIYGFCGVSPLTLSRLTFEEAAQQVKFATSSLKNATAPSGIIERDRKWKDTGARETFIKSWKKAYAGAANAGRTILLEDGMSFKQLSAIPAKDMQYIEGRALSTQEICGIFRVPQGLIGKDEVGKYNSISEKARSFTKFTLMPHITRIEQAMRQSLMPDEQNIKLQFYVDELLRADGKTRMETGSMGVKNSILTINEARAIENRPPIEGGNNLLVPLNMGIGFNREEPDDGQ